MISWAKRAGWRVRSNGVRVVSEEIAYCLLVLV